MKKFSLILFFILAAGIFGPGFFAIPAQAQEAGKRSDETAECEEQKMGSEEKKGEIKSGEQQP